MATIANIAEYRRGPWLNLPQDSRTILWALRRLVIGWPRPPCLHAALIEAYGDNACGIEHLLRCLLTGIAMHGQQRLEIGAPCCAALLPHEAELLEAIGLDGAEPDPTALIRLCDNPAAAQLCVIAAGLRAAVAGAAH
jgi:hypothetical protein